MVNTARGGLVDDEALIAALKTRRLAAAGLDVFEGEPFFHQGYLELDNVVLYPHIGSSTQETRNAMGFMALDNLDGGLIRQAAVDSRAMVTVVASLLSADPAYLAREIQEAEQAGCDRFHIDVMDGHFVPNIGFGPQTVDRLKSYTGKPFFSSKVIWSWINVVLYPHIGSSTQETRNAMGFMALDNLDAVLSGKPPLTPVRW